MPHFFCFGLSNSIISGLILSILSLPLWATEVAVSQSDLYVVESENGSSANQKQNEEQHWLPSFMSDITKKFVENPDAGDIRYNLNVSLYTKHWSPDPEHNNDQELIGFERQDGSNLWGVSFFKNSFHQDSQLVYWAKEFRLDHYVPNLRSKWLFGLLHGYKGEYKDKIPFNQLGIAPAIAPTIGFSTRYFEADVVFLGFNAITVVATLPIRF